MDFRLHAIWSKNTPTKYCSAPLEIWDYFYKWDYNQGSHDQREDSIESSISNISRKYLMDFLIIVMIYQRVKI